MDREEDGDVEREGMYTCFGTGEYIEKRKRDIHGLLEA